MAIGNISCSDKVIIVYKQSDFKKYQGVKQAFLVEPNNKRQLEKARQWGTEYTGSKLFGQVDKYEPLEYFTDNDGFKITIAESADQSSQGGKLSFWNCIVEKDGHKFMLGINQDILLSLIQQSTIINGVVQEPCKLVKLSGTAGAVHSGMVEMQRANEISSEKRPSKTTLWKLGQSYKTKTKDDIYIGKIYEWFDVETTTVVVKNTGSYYGTTSITHYHFKMMDKPKEYLAMFSGNGYYVDGFRDRLEDGTINNLSQVYDAIFNELKAKYAGKTAHWEVRYMLEFLFQQDKKVTKPISREIGNYKVDVDDYSESAKRLLDEVRRMSISGEIQLYEYYLSDYIGFTHSADEKPEFTDEDKKNLMKKLSNTTHIDFGDGIELTGTKIQ